MKLVLISILMLCGKVFAADPMVREHVLRTSMFSYTEQVKPMPVWISSVKV